VPSAGSSAVFLGEAGFWEMTAVAREGQSLDEVEKLLLPVVGKLSAGEFRQEDLDAVVLDAEIEAKERLESNEARAEEMMDAYVHHLPWQAAVSQLDAMRAVTREDVMRVSRQYLGQACVVVRRVRGETHPPKIEKPAITPVAIDAGRESALAREVKAMPAPPLEPEWLVEGVDYERVALPAGTMIASRNRRHDLFAVTYRFELGSRRRRLLCHALALLDRSGAEGFTAAELKRRLFAMGTTIDTECDGDETALSVSGVDRNMAASVQLLERWLRTARFDEKTVAALAANEISRRNDEMQEPEAIGQALAEYTARGADSRFLTVPSDRELRAASPGGLRALLAALPDFQHRTTYFGPRPAEEAARAVALGRRHRPVPARDPVRYRRSAGTRIFLVSRKLAQSQLHIAAPQPPIARDDRVLARLYSLYMDGHMGAVVSQEMREARGLAYSAWAAYAAGVRPKDQSAVLAFVGTQSDKTVDALTTMLALLHRPPVDESRFAVARRALDEEYRASRVDPRAAPAWVQSWDDRGESSDPRPREWQLLETLDASALADFATRAASGPFLLGIMGNPDRAGRAALAHLAPLAPIPASSLFGYGDTLPVQKRTNLGALRP